MEDIPIPGDALRREPQGVEIQSMGEGSRYVMPSVGESTRIGIAFAPAWSTVSPYWGVGAEFGDKSVHRPLAHLRLQLRGGCGPISTSEPRPSSRLSCEIMPWRWFGAVPLQSDRCGFGQVGRKST